MDLIRTVTSPSAAMSTSPPVKRQSVPLRSPFLPSSPEPDGPMTADVWIGTRKRDWDSAFRIKHDEFEATLRDNEAWLDLYWESIQGLRCLNESDIMVSNALKTSSARRRGRPRTHVRDVFVDGAPGDCLSPPLLTNAISMSRSISATLGGRGLGVSDTLTSSQATLVNGGEAQGVALGRGSIGRYPAVLSRNNSAATKAFEAAKRFKQVHSEYEADQILRQIDRSRDNKDWLPAVVGGADGEGDNVGDDLAASPNEHRENGELLPRLQTADGLGCGGGVQRGRPAMLMFQQAGSEASVGQRSPARADLGVGEDGQKLRPISTLASQSPMATPRARPLTVSFSQDSAAGDGEQTRSPRSRFQATSPIPSLREFILNGGSRFSRAPASPSAALSPQSSATVASPSSAAGKDGNLTSLSRSSSKYIPDWADAFNRASTSRSGTPVAQLESISATLSSKGSIGPVSERPKISSPLVSGQGPSDEQESGFSEGMAAVVGASLDGPEIRNLESNITTEDAGAGSTLPASDGNKDELVVECPLARTKLPPEESEMSEQAGEVAESSPMPTSPNGGRRSSAEATTTAEDEEESVGSDDANNSEKDNHDIDETTHEEEDAAALDGAGRLSYAGELAKDGNESEDNELESDMEDLNKDLDDIQAAIGPPTPMPQRPASLLKASRQEPDSAGEDAYESDDTDSDDGGENQVVVGRESEVVAGPPKKQAGIQTTKTPAKLLPRKPSKKVMGTTTQIKPGSVAATRRMFEQANVAPITPRMKSPVPTMHGTGAKSLATPSNTQYQPQNAGSLQQQKQPSKRAPVVAATTTYASGSVSNTSVFKNISRVKLQMQTARNGNSTAPSASASTSVRHGALSRTNTASNSTLFKSIRKVPSRAETLEVTSSTAPHATSQQQPTLAVSKKGSVSSLKRSATAGETLSKVSSSSSLRSKVGDTGGKQRDADPTPRGASQQHQHQQQQQQQRTEPKVAGGNSGGSGLFSAVMSAIASPISWISSNTSQEHVSQDRAASRYALGTGEESPLASRSEAHTSPTIGHGAQPHGAATPAKNMLAGGAAPQPKQSPYKFAASPAPHTPHPQHAGTNKKLMMPVYEDKQVPLQMDSESEADRRSTRSAMSEVSDIYDPTSGEGKRRHISGASSITSSFFASEDGDDEGDAVFKKRKSTLGTPMFDTPLTNSMKHQRSMGSLYLTPSKESLGRSGTSRESIINKRVSEIRDEYTSIIPPGCESPPEIESEYSEDEFSPDSGRKKNNWPVPRWAQSPHLYSNLQRQMRVNPDKVFGRVKPIQVSEIFGVRYHNRPRRSTMVWTGTDELTPAEEDEYNRRMGFDP